MKALNKFPVTSYIFGPQHVFGGIQKTARNDNIFKVLPIYTVKISAILRLDASIPQVFQLLPKMAIILKKLVD